MSHWRNHEIDALSDFLEAVGIKRSFIITIFVDPDNLEVVENTANVHGLRLVRTDKPNHYRVASNEGTQPLPEFAETNEVEFYD